LQAQKTATDYYQCFIDSLARSQHTQKKYIRELNYYLKWLQVTDPNILITEDLLDPPAAIRQVEDQIIEYVKYLSNIRKLGSSALTYHCLPYSTFIRLTG
jgi:hypothetical protein